MAEPPLSDRELRILRGMMDEHEQHRILDSWFSARWRFAIRLVAVTSAAAVTVAAIMQLVNGR